MPDTINTLCLHQPVCMYNILFQTGWSVINSFGNDHNWLDAQSGKIAIVHTWGQTLSLHPPLHSIVSCGGILPSPNGEGQGVRWVKEKRTNGNYLFPKPVIEKAYQLYFIQKLQTMLNQQKIKTTDVTAVKNTI